jgi:peptidoglycan hydrolase-like protein with peptidoglycan-binding domain
MLTTGTSIAPPDLRFEDRDLKEAAMKMWRSTLALFVAGAMLVTTAYAQQPMAPSADKPKGKDKESATGTSDTGKSDTGRDGGLAGAKGEQVKTAQQALKDKGHDPGAIDGVMGPKTQAAVRDFQSKEGLKASGRLDTETLAKLGVAKGAAATPSAPSASPPSAGGGTPGLSGTKSPSGTK